MKHSYQTLKMWKSILIVIFICGMMTIDTTSSYGDKTSLEQWEDAKNIYEAGNYRKALRKFKRIVERFPTSSEAPEAQFMVGKCYEKLGLLYEATKNYQKTVDKYPATKRWKEIVERQKKIADYFYNRAFKERSIIMKVKEFFGERDFGKAANIYKMVINNYPFHPNADRIQYRIGKCYLKIGKYEVARTEFFKVISTYPGSPFAEKAKYQIAMCWVKESEATPYNKETITQAINSLSNFLRRYPESKLTSSAKEKLENLTDKKGEKIYQIAKFYERRGELKAAQIYYQHLINKFPTSIWAEKAKIHLQAITVDEK